MNVRQIVTEYLEANGFDGLAGDDCGCELDDLMVCCVDSGSCKPGRKRECDPEDSHDGCSDWIMEEA